MLQRNHKAKRLDTGRWIEGFYSSWTDVKGNGNYQIRSTNGYQNDVDFTTASQSIGLLDIEENRIYENDIVEFVYCPQSLKQKIIGQIARDQWGHPVIADGKALYHIENATKGKIIGNIFDNPELLQTVF
ncbi:MAG: YopX family protein [Lutibacter sp.]|jgi:uncharacterized phage protein (TIGR01671 family)